MIDTGLGDKVALVTGANNPLGIGAAAARALAGQGRGCASLTCACRPSLSASTRLK